MLGVHFSSPRVGGFSVATKEGSTLSISSRGIRTQLWRSLSMSKRPLSTGKLKRYDAWQSALLKPSLCWSRIYFPSPLEFFLASSLPVFLLPHLLPDSLSRGAFRKKYEIFFFLYKVPLT